MGQQTKVSNFEILHKPYIELLSADYVDQQEFIEGVMNSDRNKGLSSYFDLQSNWIDRIGKDDSFREVMCRSSDVVASTCLGLSSLKGTEEVEFDLCIIDEAGKALPTEALVPIARSTKVVLVGDDKQLPPHIDECLTDRATLERYGIQDARPFTKPLFSRMSQCLPDKAVSKLTYQYRMASPIGTLISDCFYDGTLVNKRTSMEHPDLSQSVSDSKANAIWLTTHEPDNRYERGARSKTNRCEVDIAMELLEEISEAIKDGSKRNATVLLVSGYTAQVRELKFAVNKNRRRFPFLDIECNTIDACQGQEADVVLLSVTRSNEHKNIGFMDELERVNVALSRAKDLLLIVGDGLFISQTSIELKRVWEHLRNNANLDVTSNFGATNEHCIAWRRCG